jgi:ubiquinone/menaquinone biosynthesis C-methylase UbiE
MAKESYRAHERAYDAYATGADRSAVARTWLDPDSVNTWRMARMYRLADPLLEAFPGAHWLTVGDGRFGIDSRYLAAHGAKALPTDISTTLLEEAQALGLIAEYRKENAECLSLGDESFDFVLCKESYHHFPRPMIALYEMLRVARRGVLLIEPSDHEIADSVATVLSRLAKNLIKRILRRPAGGHRFEELGNYVYGISRREIEKLALGAGYPAVAFRGINDYYRDGIEFEPARAGSAAFREVRSRIARYDLLCRLGINQYGLLAALILRQLPDPGLADALRRHGYDVVRLPARKPRNASLGAVGGTGPHWE